jgi:hypothetical protein
MTRRPGRRGAVIGVGGALLALLAGTAPALGQVPDLASMSGIPLPMTDVPAGTASVRVVRGDMAHPVIGLEVVLEPVGAGTRQRQATNSTGRAIFENLGGDEYVAVATVDGAELRSQRFRAGAPGLRMLLVGPAPAGGPARGAPASIPAVGTLPPGHPPINGLGAVPGGAAPNDDVHAGLHGPASAPASQPSGPTTTDPARLSLAAGSEIIIDFVEDVIRVTQVFRLRNDGPTYDPGPRGLSFPLPDDVADVSVPRLGPRLQVEGKRAVIRTGLIAPGESRVAMQYVVPFKRAVDLVIPLPVRSEGLLVGHRPTGLSVTVAGSVSRDEIDSPEGGRYLVYRMGSLGPGAAITVRLAQSRRVEWVAAALLLGLLGWALFGGRGASATVELQALETRRERLLDELVTVERQRSGKESRKLLQRRDDLRARLEQVYRELDEKGAELV